MPSGSSHSAALRNLRHFDPRHLTAKSIKQENIERFYQGDFLVHPMLGWWAKDLRDIIDLEFDMYRHHNRIGRGEAEKKDGKLHNMIFSIIQQLARADPALYIASVSLRKDHETRLVSLPQCTRYIQRSDEADAFYIPERFEGEHQVYDEICLDGGQEYEFLGGFTADDLEEWSVGHQGERKNGQAVETLVTFVKDRGHKWNAAVPQMGDVVFMAPGKPTRLQSQTQNHYRAISASFVAIKADGESLEGGSSLGEVSTSHLRLWNVPKQDTAAPLMPFKFAPAVELCGLGYISDALVGRRSWDSSLILKERDHIMSCSSASFNKWYGQWKKKATRLVREAREAVKEDEKAAFGKRSYFVMLQKFQAGLDSFPPHRLNPMTRSSRQCWASQARMIMTTVGTADEKLRRSPTPIWRQLHA